MQGLPHAVDDAGSCKEQMTSLLAEFLFSAAGFIALEAAPRIAKTARAILNSIWCVDKIASHHNLYNNKILIVSSVSSLVALLLISPSTFRKGQPCPSGQWPGMEFTAE